MIRVGTDNLNKLMNCETRISLARGPSGLAMGAGRRGGSRQKLPAGPLTPTSLSGLTVRISPPGTAWDRIKIFLRAKVGRKIGARIGGRVLWGHNLLVASEKVGLFRITQKAGLWEQGKNTFRRDAEPNPRDAGATRRTIQRKSLISHLTRRNKMAE